MNIIKKKSIFDNCIFIIILLMLSLNFSGCQIAPPVPEEAKWTIMVYMAAGNELESVGIQDINEMEVIGSTTDINIVVQMDRISFDALDNYGYGYLDDVSNSNWTGTRRYYITQDINPEIIKSRLIMDLGEKNMGDPETLKDFTQWVIQNYPAQRYMLILWNHGGGFRSLEEARDICWDYNFSTNNKITMPQLEDALAFTSGQLGGKIDILGMDACYMGMVEVAYQVKDYAQILIASEASVPGDGWQYDDILQELVINPNQLSRNFAVQIVDSYNKQYSAAGSNITLSAIDLSKMDELAARISGLAQGVINDLTVPKKNYRDARNNSQHYTGVGFEYIDLVDFVTQLPDYTSNSTVLSYANQINQLMEVGNIIISNTYSGNSVEGSNGLTIYFPYYSYDINYNHSNFAQEKLWDEMLLHLDY